MVGGIHGGGFFVAGGKCGGGGACMAEEVYGRGMCGRGCAWQGACMMRGVHGRLHPCQGVCVAGACMAGGCAWHADLPINRMTDTCRNITLPQTSFAGGNTNAISENLECILTFVSDKEH